MSERTIYLIRHGKIQLPDDRKRFIGQIDLQLNEDGIGQAVCLRERLAGEDIGFVYCSDLLRTRQTAEIIACDRDIEIVEEKGLREIYLGEWEGRTFEEIELLFPGEFRARGEDIAGYRVPGGESFADCSKRTIAAFDDIVQSSDRDIVIVGHAGVNRLIFCHVLGMQISNLFRINQGYGCLNAIRCLETGFLAESINIACGA